MKIYLAFMVFLSSLIWNPPLSFAQNSKSPESKVGYIGTYTQKEGHVDGKAEGIYSIHLNPITGSLEFGKTLAEITNPSFIKTSDDKQFLYAVSELGPKDGASGLIFSYRILEDNSLEEINALPTNGFAPCHIEVDTAGDFVFVSNYSGGVVTVYQTDPEGALVEKQVISLENKKASHPHSVTLSADDRVAYIADLGNDRIWIFDFDPEKAQLKPQSQVFVALEKGAGPRHFVISEDSRFAYSMNELNSSVSAFKILERGGLELIQNISSLPYTFEGKNSGADIHMHPSGNFLYVSNRGHNSIASFRIDETSGTLRSTGYTESLGKTPRNFAISPDGNHLFVANQDSDTVTSFGLDENGQLTYIDSLDIPTPVCIEFK